MEMQIQARNTRLSQDTRAYLTKKLERIGGRLKLPVDAHVVVSQEKTRSRKDRFVVEVTLRCNGTLLRGQERAASVQAAVDSLSTTLDRRVEQFKSKFYRSGAAKRSGEARSIRGIEAPASEEEPEEEFAPLGRVVRSKRFPMKPMSVEEAAIQMEMLDHAFFLFHNAATGIYNVLYRRSDGDYGLIEPDHQG